GPGGRLRPAEPFVDGPDVALAADPVDAVPRGDGRTGDVERRVGRVPGQVVGGDAGRQRGERRGVTAVRQPEDGAGSIADVEHALGIEGEAAGDAELGGDGLGAAGGVDARDGAVEAAGHVQAAL